MVVLPIQFDLEVSRYPGRFARAVYLGQPPPFSPSADMASATMTLLKFDSLFIGVTCQHVLAHYREMQGSHPSIIFQIGQVRFNPLIHLVNEDKGRDLATFDLTSFVGNTEGLSESSFIEPHSWPPSDISEGDVICYAGFPGIWRERLSPNELRFHSFGSGATFVRSVGEEHFVIRIEAEKLNVTLNKGMVVGSIGGLSGGPVFSWRKGGLLRAELVGFIYEYSESLDLMYVRLAKVLNLDGKFI